MKIAVTGGHLTPALATIAALKRAKKDVEFIFYGRIHALEGDPAISIEYETIKSLGIKFIPLTTGRLQRRLTKLTIPSLLKIPFGFFQALISLFKEKSDVIVSFGGYLSPPVVVAGWLLGIPSIIHEQTSKIGLATRVTSFFAKKIALSFRQTLKFFPEEKRVLTGNPLREEIFEKDAATPTIGLFIKRIKKERKRLIFITGGNLGSHSINMAVKDILEELDKRYAIIHQTGRSKVYQDLERLDKEARRVKCQNYLPVEYIKGEDIGAVLNRTDLVVCRSGANICWELLALSKTALLIPLPWAGGGEQKENATILEKTGIAEVLGQEDLTPKNLLWTIGKMMRNLKKYQGFKEKAQNTVEKRAADKLAKEVLTLVS